MPEVEHLSCREVVDLVTDYLEGALSPARTSLFEEHLNFCDGCVAYLEQMRLTVRAAGRLHEEDVPAGLKEELLRAFRDWERGG